MSALKLTKLGEFVNRYSVLTDVEWWRILWMEANVIADEDGEVVMFFDEKIAGLTEMRDRFYELNETAAARSSHKTGSETDD